MPIYVSDFLNKVPPDSNEGCQDHVEELIEEIIKNNPPAPGKVLDTGKGFHLNMHNHNPVKYPSAAEVYKLSKNILYQWLDLKPMFLNIN